ncbi:hypothetical protein HCN44_000110 [Aphidius gifuensis]|uniref:Protein kintoun n=1 Tax=Aphidius gifuensis TaxID=684658 RepID=A0A835CRK2_APHGI|nr:hypothetical protein HCN44_000110 [Aphidius gifuensis]
MDARVNRNNNWEELDVTKKELNNINECLKNKEFRKLLIEYADEINNPDNRKLYQDELTQLEKERGIDIKFVNPEPGYVIKTTCNGDKKCFINISKSDNVEKPTSKPSQDNDKIRGLQWSLPYSLSPPRDDMDKKNHLCTVFDVVFNPDTLYLASKNIKFRKIVNETAIDGIENNFKVKLDRNNLKFPKINFKGITQSTVIRKKCDKPTENNIDIEPEIYQKLMSSYDESRNNKKSYNDDKLKRPEPSTKYTKKINKNINNDKSYTIPKFIIKHQTDMDIQDFKNTKDSKLYSAIPKKLVIIIDLPLLKTSDNAILDVQHNQLTMISEKPAKYRLDLPLPYCVDPDEGNAKFDTSNKKLTITLPVLRNNKTFEFKDDSGVDSDHGSPPNNIINTNVDNDNDDDDNEEEDDDDDKIKLFDNYNDKPTSLINEITDDTSIKNDSYSCEEHILNDNIIYSLPSFTPNIFDNTLALTVHVKNVDSTSIRTKLLDNYCGIQIIFSSVGAGFFPIYYALCFKLDNDNIFLNDTLVIEPWDNNVVFTIKINNINNLKYYYFGINNDNFMDKKELPHVVSFDDKLELLKSDESQINNEEKIIQVLPNDNELVVDIQPKNINVTKTTDKLVNKKIKLQKTRSMSESSCNSGDELNSSNGSENNRIVRGILKNRRNNISRSVSESSIDDTTGLVSSVDFNYDSVAELNSESECSSFKKTVRFNDVVSRQLFSILGRRKKNQRKLQKKKQAHDRRMSESENSETDERDKYKIVDKINHVNDDKGIENVKPILNREKSAQIKTSNNDTDNFHDDDKNDLSKIEFKNDLIFQLDM